MSHTQVQLTENATEAVSQLLGACEAYEGAAGVACVYFPDSETCDGFVGGSQEGVRSIIADVIDRLYNCMAELTTPQEARMMIRDALDRAEQARKDPDSSGEEPLLS